MQRKMAKVAAQRCELYCSSLAMGARNGTAIPCTCVISLLGTAILAISLRILLKSCCNFASRPFRLSLTANSCQQACSLKHVAFPHLKKVIQRHV